MNARWSPFAKQIVVIGSLAAAIWFLARVSILLTPIILALLLAYLISFPVGWLVRQTGVPRLAAVIAFYVLVVVILITGPALLVPRLVALISGLSVTLRHVLFQLIETTPRPIVLGPNLSIDLGPFYAPLNQWLMFTFPSDPLSAPGWQGLLFPFANRAVTVVRSALNSLVWSLFILAVSFYVAKDAPTMGRFIASRIPEKIQSEIARLWRELTLIWDAYVRGQIILGALMAVITWSLMSILGVRNSAALGLLAFLVEFVPGVGHVVAAIIAIVIALATGSTWLPLPNLWFALVVAVVYILMSQFENVYLLPRIIGHQIALHPVVVIVGALAGAHIGGVLGILLAPPTIASLRVLFGYAVHKLLDEDPYPTGNTTSPEHDLYWRGLFRDHPVSALIFDLDGTLVQTDSELEARLARQLERLRPVLPLLRPTLTARRFLLVMDALANEFTSFLNQLHLSGLLFRLNRLLRRVRAYRAPADFIPVPGSLEELRALAQDYPLALVTNRSAYDAAAFLAKFDLSQVFHVVITRDDVHFIRSHPASLKLAARRLGVPPGYCVMVGDTPSDLHAARLAGTLMVGVLSGFGSPHDLRSADLVIPSVADLCRWLHVNGDRG